jgi:hypothetical protein
MILLMDIFQISLGDIVELKPLLSGGSYSKNPILADTSHPIAHFCLSCSNIIRMADNTGIATVILQ